MKKIISIVLCLAMLLCFAACSKAEEGPISYKTYEIDKYKVELPATYEYNDLKKVKAEPDCVAMLTDKNGELPDLWIYVDPQEGNTVKGFVFNQDDKWDFNEINVYKKNGHTVAKTVFDEVWYGTLLLNEVYYRTEMESDGNKVLWFDFAYDDRDDMDAMHAYAEEIAEHIGF